MVIPQPHFAAIHSWNPPSLEIEYWAGFFSQSKVDDYSTPQFWSVRVPLYCVTVFLYIVYYRCPWILKPTTDLTVFNSAASKQSHWVSVCVRVCVCVWGWMYAYHLFIYTFIIKTNPQKKAFSFYISTILRFDHQCIFFKIWYRQILFLQE